MPSATKRHTIGRIMGWVAVVAVTLALLPTAVGPFVLIIGMLVGLVPLLAQARGMTRVRVAAWVFSAYPFLLWSFGVLLLLARPVGLLAPCVDFLWRALALGTLPALWLTLGCVITEWVRATAGGQDRTHSIAGLLGFALTSWVMIPVLTAVIATLLVRLR